MKIGIINYGVGNINSVFNTLSKVHDNVKIVENSLDIKNYDKIVLPGTGSFYKCINILKKNNWFHEIEDFVLNKKKYILGICLGMQLFSKNGYEGSDGLKSCGFNFIDGEVKSLVSQGCTLRVPLIGWNEINLTKDSILMKNIENNSDVYFINSYCLIPNSKDVISATTSHDIEFVSAIEKDNIFGTQFHPEKSSFTGIQILKNFVNA